MTASKSTVLIIAVIAAFVTPFMGSAVNVALPAVGAEYEAHALHLSWVATAFSLASAMLLLPFGKIADRFGRKTVFLYGTAVYALASAASALSPSVEWLIATRAVQGVGAALTFGTSIAIVTSVFEPGQRGRILGITVSSTYIGLSAGPFLGGLMTTHWGWRSIFWSGALLSTAVLALAGTRLKGEWHGDRTSRIDVAGSLLYSASLALTMYGFSRMRDTEGMLLLPAGILLLALFIRRERTNDAPLIDLSLFRHNIVFAFSNLAALINYSATAGVGFLMSLYLQYGKGCSPQTAGLILVSQPVMMAILSPAAGSLSDRLEPRIVASIGMGLTALALLMLVFVSTATPMPYIVVTLMILGTGFALFSSPNTNAVMGSVGHRHYGVASSALSTMRVVGQTFSLGIAMLLLSVFVGTVRMNTDAVPPFLAAMRACFGLFAVLCTAGVFASLARGNVHS